MLAVYLAHVGDEKGIFLASITNIGIDGFDAFFQGSFNDLLCILSSVFVETAGIVFAIVFSIDNNRCILFDGVDGRWCHSLAGKSCKEAS